METVFNPTGDLVIEEVRAWMDGGSVTLITMDTESKSFEIEFVQKVVLNQRADLPHPGSLLLRGKEVQIRSELESRILSLIQNAQWGSKINDSKKMNLKQMISECIDFVRSDEYLEVARKVGRI